MSADSSSPQHSSDVDLGKTRMLRPDQIESETDKALPDQTLPDDELFIRKTFQVSPQKGFELLFREYYGPLCSHAIRFVYTREVARDIVSDTFSVFWQKELHTQITTSYRAYLYAAVRNRSLKYLQREFGRQILGTSFDSPDDRGVQIPTETLTPEDLLAYDELHNRVEVAIGELSPQRQRVFLMNRFEGKKYQTIADELQISLKAVEAHISKALASLRKALQHE